MTNRDKGPPNYRLNDCCLLCKFVRFSHDGRCCKKYPDFYNDAGYVCDDYEAEAGEGETK